MSDTRTALDALSKLVQNKTRYPFVLKTAWWRSLLAAVDVILMTTATLCVAGFITAMIMILLGQWSALIGMAVSSGVFVILACLKHAAMQGERIPETTWNEITALITDIVSKHPDLVEPLRSLADSARDTNVNTVWGDAVVRELKTVQKTAEAESKHKMSAQKINDILDVPTSCAIPLEANDTILVEESAAVEPSPAADSSNIKV